MADDYMIEIEFVLGGEYDRDVDLLESIGIQLEEIAPDTGPSAAIHGPRYSVTLITAAQSVLEAGTLAATITVEAVNRALRERGDELADGAFETLVERMLVEHAAKPAELALA
jgi:replicative DNA helicase